MAEAVKVIVRCRPMNRREKDLNSTKIVKVNRKDFTIQIENPEDNKVKGFTFDSVFDDDSTQDQVYTDSSYRYILQHQHQHSTSALPAASATSISTNILIVPILTILFRLLLLLITTITTHSLVSSVLEGFNGTIFAYGQTGCGKTFTMEGLKEPNEMRGMIPKAFDHIFRQIGLNDQPEKQFLVQAAYIEIYNEDVRDLLGDDHTTALQLKEDPDRGVYIKGLKQTLVDSVDKINDLMAEGNTKRTVGATLMNAGSSRSHSIFMVRIETSEPDPNAKEEGDVKIKAGKLNLVDLAGSERQSKTAAEGQRLKEATKINLSLSALGNVISALVAGGGGKKVHIPYRDSKLTRLLQDSLGGNTKTVMIAAISPAADNFEETTSTLRYANRAKNIKNKPKINEDPKDALLREYQDEIKRLKALLVSKGLLKSVDGEIPPAPKVAAAADDGEEEEEEDEGDEEESDEEEEGEDNLQKMANVGMAAVAKKKKKSQKKGLADVVDEAKMQEEMEKKIADAKKKMEEDIANMRAEKEAQEMKAREMLELHAEEQQKTQAIKDEEEAALNARIAAEKEKHAANARALQEQYAAEAAKRKQMEGRIEKEKAKLEASKDSLESKLAMLQNKLISGGDRMKDIEAKAEEDKQRAAAEIEQARHQQVLLEQEAERHAEDKLMLDKQFENVNEDLRDKNAKLKRVMAKYQTAKEDLDDVQKEWAQDKEGLLAELRDTNKELELYKQIIGVVVSKYDYAAIVRECKYDEDMDKWFTPERLDGSQRADKLKISPPPDWTNEGPMNSARGNARGRGGGSRGNEGKPPRAPEPRKPKPGKLSSLAAGDEFAFTINASNPIPDMKRSGSRSASLGGVSENNDASDNEGSASYEDYED